MAFFLIRFRPLGRSPFRKAFRPTFGETSDTAFFLAFGKSVFAFSHHIRHFLYLAVEKLFCKINQFHRFKQPPKRFILHNFFRSRFFLDNNPDSTEPLSRIRLVILSKTQLFKLEELFNFHENLLNLWEELLAMTHFIDMMDVFMFFFREKFKIQKSKKIDMRQFKFFALMDLIFNNTRYIVFYAILE